MKNLSVENFLEADPSAVVVSNMIDSSGNVSVMTAGTWTEIILESKLAEIVPEDVRNLFETARGALVYGYFFYPLYSLGCEQMSRVAEAATKARCETLGASKKQMKTFECRINFLVAGGIISAGEAQSWHYLRELRNSSSHASMQNIYSPAMFIGIMERIIEQINDLFM